MSREGYAENPLLAGLDEVRSSWGWFLGLGILLMVLGAICIIGNVTATFTTVLVFGWLLLISGIFALVQAFRTRNWSGFFLHLAQCAVQRIYGLFADPLSARRSCKSHVRFWRAFSL